MTNKYPLPPLPEPLCNLPTYCQDAIRQYTRSVLDEQDAAIEADQQNRSDEWRKLAHQFDSHRMQAISHLKAIVGHLPVDMQPPIRNFLSAPPDRQARGEPVAWTVKGVSRPRTWTWWVGIHDDAESTAKLNATALGDVSLAVPLYEGPQPQQQAGEPIGYFYQWELDRSISTYPNGFPDAVPVYANPQPQQIPEGFIDSLAQEIRRVDGNHSLGTGALAEALMPFLSRAMLEAAPEPKDQK